MPGPTANALDLAAVARLEESRLARGLAEIAVEHRLIGAPTLEAGAAVAGFGEPGSWLNNVVNLGMNGPVERSDVEALTHAYIGRGIEPRIELCPYAHPSAARHCGALGFVLNPSGEGEGTPGAFETVLYRVLTRDRVAPPAPLSCDAQIEVVDPRDEECVREYTEVALSGFFPPGVSPTDNDRKTVFRAVRHPRTVSMVAMLNGRIIAAGAIEIAGDVCALFGATVVPEFRRRGVQQALIAARLNLAIKRSAKVATIGSRPGIPTERNVMRMGFSVAYTKVILVKQEPGLKGVVG